VNPNNNSTFRAAQNCAGEFQDLLNAINACEGTSYSQTLDIIQG